MNRLDEHLQSNRTEHKGQLISTPFHTLYRQIIERYTSKGPPNCSLTQTMKSTCKLFVTMIQSTSPMLNYPQNMEHHTHSKTLHTG